MKVVGRIDNLLGIARSASEGRIGAADLRQRPLTRPGELLETVPGLIVTQHSGDGKANQYFVRGFNLDHGTDFQTRVEGMPVNMPTHAHGQGYTDLGFIIPEFVDHLDYKLGVSHAELGDFGSAGGAEFHLARSLDRPFAAVGRGANGFTRLVGGGSSPAGGGTLLLGGEAMRYDGPWLQPQRLRKLSGIARYSVKRGRANWNLLAMTYTNRWNASDQLPRRAVDMGLVSRFGTIDSTNGGRAERFSMSGSFQHVGRHAIRDVNVFGVYSDLRLFSNFGYFLDDAVRGDQFAQHDRRIVVGVNARQTQTVNLLGTTHMLKLGVQARTDFIGDLALYHTVARVHASDVRTDRVRQTSSGAYAEVESRWLPRFRSVAGLRGDVQLFRVASDRAENSGRRAAGIASPKLALIFAPGAGAELYASGGMGFHSNDARGTVINVDPLTGDRAARVDPLVRSHGAEVGVRLTRAAAIRTTVSVWTLDLASELRFVGDAGGTEAAAASRRSGVTIANFYRPRPNLTLDGDLSLARARLRGSIDGHDRLPGALERVVAAGITWDAASSGAFGALRLRQFGGYPLAEDNRVRGRGSALVNAEAGYAFRSGTRIRASVLNALNARADDIQYFYTSRLRGEPADGVDDVHFHPAEPRQLRMSLEWKF